MATKTGSKRSTKKASAKKAVKAVVKATKTTKILRSGTRRASARHASAWRGEVAVQGAEGVREVARRDDRRERRVTCCGANRAAGQLTLLPFFVSMTGVTNA